MPVRDVTMASDRALTPASTGSTLGACDAQYLVDGGDALARSANAFDEKGAHPLLHGHRPQLLGVTTPLDLEPKVVVHHQELVHARATAISGVAAFVAPPSLPNALQPVRVDVDSSRDRLVGTCFRLAVRADHS